MVKLGEFVRAQKTVLSNRKYALLFAVLTIVFAWLFYYLTSIPGQSFESWQYSTRNASKAFVVIAAPLLALVFTSEAFVLKRYGGGGFHGLKSGSALGAFAAGAIATACCSPIAAGVLALLGFVGASTLAIRYENEVFASSIALILIAWYYSTKAIFCEDCRIKVEKAFSQPARTPTQPKRKSGIPKPRGLKPKR